MQRNLWFPAKPQIGSDTSKHLHLMFLTWQHISSTLAKLHRFSVQSRTGSSCKRLHALVPRQITRKPYASSRTSPKPACLHPSQPSERSVDRDLELSPCWMYRPKSKHTQDLCDIIGSQPKPLLLGTCMGTLDFLKCTK